MKAERLPLSAHAGFAQSENFEYVRINLKLVVLADAFFYLFHQATVEVRADAALLADEVMVVFAWLHHFIAAFAIAKIYCLHQTHGDK